MKVKILKCNNPNYWAYDHEGEVREVYHTNWKSKIHRVTDLFLFNSWVGFSDCEVLNEEISEINENSDAIKLCLSYVISCSLSDEDTMKKLASEFISSTLSATKGCTEVKYEFHRF